MKLNKTRIRVPLPEPLFGVVKSFLSQRDRELLIAVYETKLTDAEIAETFGAEAGARVRELERGIGELVFLKIDSPLGEPQWKRIRRSATSCASLSGERPTTSKRTERSRR